MTAALRAMLATLGHRQAWEVAYTAAGFVVCVAALLLAPLGVWTVVLAAIEVALLTVGADRMDALRRARRTCPICNYHHHWEIT